MIQILSSSVIIIRQATTTNAGYIVPGRVRYTTPVLWWVQVVMRAQVIIERDY